MKSMTDRLNEVCTTFLESVGDVKDANAAEIDKIAEEIEKINDEIEDLDERIRKNDTKENRGFVGVSEWEDKKKELLKEQAVLYRKMQQLETKVKKNA